MPVFLFVCTECGKEFEKLFLHKVAYSITDQINDFLQEKCQCGGKIERRVGVPNLKFVGKDFYVTEERARRERSRIAGDIREANDKIKSDRKD